MTMTRKKTSSGFTLIELIIVIAITGIIAGMVAVFLKAPVDSYFSTVRRAQLTEEADSTLRFIARDMQAALPNSIVCTSVPKGGRLQFLSIRSGGRYREEQTLDKITGTASGTPLQFGTPTATFDMIGTDANSAVTTDAYGNSVSAAPSMVVVGNLSLGVAGCHSSFSAFADNAAKLTGFSANSVTIGSNVGGSGYPPECNLASPIVQDVDPVIPTNEVNNREFGRFYVVNSAPVTYVCDTDHGLTRDIGAGPVAMVARDHLSACQVACDDTKARVQLVTVNLTLKDQTNELVNMLRRVTIVNRP